MRSYSSGKGRSVVVAAFLCLSLLGFGCAQSDEEARRAEIDKIRERINNSLTDCDRGSTDGQAGREADEARAACEEPILKKGNQELSRLEDHPSCDGLIRVDNTPAGSRNNKMIFFLCDDGESTGLYGRPAGDLSTAVALIEQYLVAGPSAEEASNGFGVAHRRPAGDAIVGMGDGGQLEIELPHGFGQMGGSTWFLVGFEAELGANAFQFDEVESIVLTQNGSCETLWELTEYGGCQTITRANHSKLLRGLTS